MANDPKGLPTVTVIWLVLQIVTIVILVGKAVVYPREEVAITFRI